MSILWKLYERASAIVINENKSKPKTKKKTDYTLDHSTENRKQLLLLKDSTLEKSH